MSEKDYIDDLIERDTPKSPSKDYMSLDPKGNPTGRCPRCGSYIRLGIERFCLECGQRLHMDDNEAWRILLLKQNGIEQEVD